LAETKGGRYSITRYGALTDQLTRYAIRKAGLDPEKDINILQVGGSRQALAAMESDQIDVAILAAPVNYIAEDKGFVKVMSQEENIAQDWPTHVIYCKEEVIAKYPNALKAIIRAQSKAIMLIKNNPDEAAKLANKVYKFELGHCRRFIDDYGSKWLADGSLPSEEGMKAFWEILIDNGDVEKRWPTSKWLDDTFLKTQNQWLKLE
jgi:NitT/TauT family transport system substrate-binding protein